MSTLGMVFNYLHTITSHALYDKVNHFPARIYFCRVFPTFPSHAELGFVLNQPKTFSFFPHMGTVLYDVATSKVLQTIKYGNL